MRPSAWPALAIGVLLPVFGSWGAGSQLVPVHLPGAVTNSVPVGRLQASTRLNLVIGLPLRNREILNQLLKQLYDPASPNYHHFLTAERFTARFGPTEQDYQALIAFVEANGLSVTATHPNRTLLDVSGPVENIEKLFHVTLRTYRHPAEGRTFYAPDAQPTLDVSIPVLGVSGLDNYWLPRPRIIARPLSEVRNARPNAGSGPSGTFMGSDFRAAYFPGSPVVGSGQTVGLLQFDGYNSNDIAYYESRAGLSPVTLSNVLLDGFSGIPTGSGGEVEVSLDIEMVISMAPGVSKVLVYEAGPSGNWHDILNRMATDNLAKQLSCSWYISQGGPDAVADQIWQQMAAQGQSFYNASGDADAYSGPIDFPGDSPYITQVGGTTLTTAGPGGAWVGETVWNWNNGTGSGGGISTSYPIPSWQTNIDMTGNQGSNTKRNIPDVALTADNVYVRADGQDYGVGGTSCSAPLWAGLTALINQLALDNGEPVVGFINPAVYSLGNSASYSSTFHDITTGDNKSPTSPNRFSAVRGFDLCTGWGTPAGSSLLSALGLPEPLRITPFIPPIITGPAGGPFLPATQGLVLTNEGSAALSWSLGVTSAWLNASPGSGALNSGGPATTVTVGLKAATTNLAAGTYSTWIQFTNLTSHFVQSRLFTLAVVTQPIITSQPSSQALFEGATATFSVGVATNALLFYQWRYDNGSFLSNLSDGGNISGSRTSTLIVNSVSPTNQGAYSVVVSNAAGAGTSADAFLTIVPWRPVITQQPVTQSVLPGAPVTYTVTAVGTHPFSYQWSRNGTTLTNGGKISGTGTSALTVSNVTSVDAGTYSVLVSNSLGSITSDGAALNLITVTAPGIALDTLAAFNGSNGEFPYSSLIQAGDGNYYGTTIEGGSSGIGTVFRFMTNGAIAVLASFNGNNGAIPYAGLLQGRDGNLYGVASQGGASGDGTVFRVPTNGFLTTLASFSQANGYLAVAGLIQDTNGNFFGTTLYGGAYSYGNIFKMTPGGVLSNLYSFNGTTGAFPSCILVQDREGSLYGTTESGNNFGNIFKLTPWGSYSTLLGFSNDDGATPVPGLTRDVHGDFYGTTYSGGADNLGTVFKMTADGVLTVLHSFAGVTDGSNPFGGLCLGADGNFYGTTESGGVYFFGTVFRISADGAFATLASFDGYQGSSPEAAPTQGTDGNLYGTTQTGGPNNMGAVYRMSVDSALQITSQPKKQLVYLGGTANFDVATFGSLPVWYQWRRNGTNLADGGNILGAHTRTLAVTNAALSDVGMYSVIASNGYGSVTSAPAVLQVVISPPWIVTETGDQTVFEGGSAVFNVEAEGDLPLYYRWRKDGTNLTDGGAISGSATHTLVVTGVTTANQGAYSVVVSDDLYWAESDPALLTVVPVVQPGFGLTTIHSFNNGTDGSFLNALIQGTNGALYGTAESGGANGYGTVFRTTTNGTTTVLVPFNQINGAYPYAGLVQGSDGNFYGTTLAGGNYSSGSIFKMTAAGTVSNLYTFTGGADGYYPSAELIQGADGNFYGTSYYGGANGYGCTFRVSPGGALTTLYSFSGGADGAYPWAGLVRGADGNFYGTTTESSLTGGGTGFGTVFRMATNGSLTTLREFGGTNGSYPIGTLTQAADGRLYGTTQIGGANGYGTVFGITTNGLLDVLFSFNNANGGDPAAGLARGSDGYLYGTTSQGGIGGYGTVFRITTNGALTTLVWFDGTHGATPEAAMIQASDGSFYGTTYYGGANGYGIIFRLTAPLPPGIHAQPTNQTVLIGTDATVSVVAIGTAPLNYQWRKGGTNLTDGGSLGGSTTANLQIHAVAETNSGAYSVVVSNAYGSVTSTDAVLTAIFAAPVITRQPTNQTVLPGTTATFTAAAYGSLPLVYQWQQDGLPLADGGKVSGSASTQLTISNASFANMGRYSVVVSNTLNSATSTGAVLSVASLTGPGIDLESVNSFSGAGSQGANPNGLAVGPDGRLYGTTQVGGSYAAGTVFVLNSDGSRGDLYSFTGGADGAYPYASLIQGMDGYLYGTTVAGGSGRQGTVFRVRTNGVPATLHSFSGSDGASPYSPVYQAADGTLFGTTYFGGAHGDGTIFHLGTNGSFNSLYSFTGSGDGGYPNAGLTPGSDGYLYGTAAGTTGYGVAFRISTNGAFATLHSFGGTSDGSTPYADLSTSLGGLMYGSTWEGGAYNQGTIFRIGTNGGFASLYAFTNAADGGSPYAALTWSGPGVLFGTTTYGGPYNAGTIFKFSTADSKLTTVAAFDGYDGANPQSPLVLAPDGSFYGTTLNGGPGGNGTIFRLTLQSPIVIRLIPVVQQSGILNFTWNGLPGHFYQVQSSSSLANGSWENLGPPVASKPDGTVMSEAIGSNSQRYYRVQLLH